MAATVHDGGVPDYNRRPWTIFSVLLGAAAAVILLLLFYAPLDPLYSASIDSVSGLDVLELDLALNPQFNLTVRVTSQSLGCTACMDAGTYMEVSSSLPVVPQPSGSVPSHISRRMHPSSRGAPACACLDT